MNPRLGDISCVRVISLYRVCFRHCLLHTASNDSRCLQVELYHVHPRFCKFRVEVNRREVLRFAVRSSANLTEYPAALRFYAISVAEHEMVFSNSAIQVNCVLQVIYCRIVIAVYRELAKIVISLCIARILFGHVEEQRLRLYNLAVIEKTNSLFELCLARRGYCYKDA